MISRKCGGARSFGSFEFVFRCLFCTFTVRRGSKINGDRFSKQVPKAKASRGVRGMLPQIIFWTLKVHFLGSRDILKNLTDFRKTVETGMHLRLTVSNASNFLPH